MNKVSDMQEVLFQYKEKAYFDGITIIETDESILNEEGSENDYILTVYSKIIIC
ncbi:hypothetical protein GCM10023310_13960 [Paenibacillus vulneris]